ncbi:translational GTPase TypA [Amphiplicatus metriothermophilus]|uniref:Large ribosomal subunit assembly factor BipA n=1 Tax=Amphiplicatus metriothermophilus TaxID=1519374 RepID=A0A239PK65_9PROT|nr:translational GTPase TypA [Amphiplicatus metriothermophilus]MBB5517954.1 GTP-binding protein [Amphiplicatus metriothermophilus]SNT67713.1 GTP-binding protein [Amphiplicatus metriothermophilus]
MSQRSTLLRNIAIVAHVDHGKTTLVDGMLRQSGAVRASADMVERAMDSDDIERERGITILAKCTSVTWEGAEGPARINIVDTPGHADFGGEVERILSMVDGCLLLVDAAEGPMPQTKFVLSKALALGLRPVVVVNKVDRPNAEPDAALDATFDLFAALGASDAQLDFPILYASGRDGWASLSLDGPRADLTPLFETIIARTPPPPVEKDAETLPFRMLATTLEADPYLGRILTGRIVSGVVRPGASLKALSRDGREIERARVTRVLAFRGLKRQPIEEAGPGDIVALAGFAKASVADTLCDIAVDDALPAQPIDPPTLSIFISANDSPLAGREGDKVQSRVIRERLMRQAEGDVAIRVSDTSGGEAFEVAGRGELQLGVLIENMRREGFELSVSRPRVLMREAEDGTPLEPIEEAVVDVDDEFAGAVIEKLTRRKAELVEMKPSGGGKTRLILHAPTRALIGYHGEFLTDTRGTGVMNRSYLEHAPYRGPIEGRRNGVLISTSDGEAVAYALWNIEERGVLFISPGEKVYQGMIIGENAKDDDLDVNPLKGKQLTNIRAAGKDEAVRLTPPRRLSLEQAIAYIADDELVEVTPKSIRLRKKALLPHLRKKRAKSAE